MFESFWSSRRAFILLLVILTLSLALIIAVRGRIPSSGNGSSATVSVETPAVSPAELQTNYRQTTVTIWQAYQARLQAVPLVSDLASTARAEWLSAANGWREELLALRVPGDSRDLHVALVFGLTDVISGLEDYDFTQVGEATDTLTALLQQYPWLGM
ncbi:hypothetical protein HY933_03755 [Candidatus Falkowbacteria bacterium]|nr:hypothetical protein [Candidatus Falkowbacteria bacterium]